MSAKVAFQDENLLRKVFAFLEWKDLSRCSLVCKTWRDVLEDESVWNECFRLKWGLKDVRGRPKNKLAFYQNASFVRRYQVQNSDSIASIALKHNLSTSTLARLNNLMSDSGLYCRKEIYLPCSRKEEVSQASVVIMHCKHTLRDYGFLSEENDKGASFEEREDQLVPQAKQAPDSKQTELLLSLMARSLKIDDESARYYLEASDYDLKAAMDTYRSDADWESSQRRLSLRKPKENLRFCCYE